jgi:hypothetical protein
MRRRRIGNAGRVARDEIAIVGARFEPAPSDIGTFGPTKPDEQIQQGVQPREAALNSYKGESNDKGWAGYGQSIPNRPADR